MTDDNLDDVQAPKLLVLRERDRVVWNEAIEEAAKQADGAYGGLADDIRKLKK